MKKCLTCLLVMIVMLLLTPTVLAADQWNDTHKSYGEQLTGIEKEIYRVLEHRFANDEVTIGSMDGNTVWDVGVVYEQDSTLNFATWADQMSPLLTNACYAFTYDHPEFFWIRTAIHSLYSGRSVAGKSHYQLKLGFTAFPDCDSVAERDQLQEQVNSVVNELLAETEGLPVVARLAYWDNWLAQNNQYNTTAADNDDAISEDASPWNITGAFFPDKSPVCEGYAKAFQLLCHRIDVPCLQLSGVGHMWNAVRLDGIWYLCDPTWNDPDSLGDNSMRNYFLTTSDGSHTVSMSLNTPELTETGYFLDWSCANGALSGCERSSSGNMLIALYDENDRMIACDFCPQFYWTGSGNAAINMNIAPEFSSSELSHAAYAVRFWVDGATMTPVNENSRF